MLAASRHDDQRLAGKVNKRGGLVYRPRSLEEFVEEACDIAGGGAPGTRLVAGAWRQGAVGELTDQTCRTEMSHGWQQHCDATDEVVGPGLDRRGRTRCRGGGVQ